MTVGAYLRSRGGLLADKGRKERLLVFFALLIVGASITFLQLSFIGMGSEGYYAAYLMTLLIPIAVAALALGWKSGALTGLCCGAVLFVHSFLMPLDPFEKYLISPLNSMLLYAGVGLVLGLSFDAIRQRGFAGTRKYVAIAIACIVASVFATTVLDMTLGGEHSTFDQLKAYVYSGDSIVQMAGDALLMFVSCVATDLFVGHLVSTSSYASMRILFRTNLIVALVIAYLMASSIGFAVVTVQEKDTAYNRVGDELAFITEQFSDRWGQLEYLSARMADGQISEEDFFALRDMVDMQDFLDGYSLVDGTILVITDGTVLFSNNPVFKSGKDLYKGLDIEVVELAAKEDEMVMILYDEGTDVLQLGYMRAMGTLDNTYVVKAMPFSKVFEHRREMVFWTSLITFVLLVLVYFLATHLLRKIVVNPINGINHSLGKIVEGDLDELVHETESVEFASLSAGINVTVDALKGWIGEAERSLERELSTARAIQEGALPRQYPAFPDVECVDLYATMNAAKDVGGDFYDFFMVDDHTVCFLIADVSGKGIPGALFMMSAKTELQNHLSSGVDPVEAIAATNKYLCEHNEAGMFVTVWAATLDWSTGVLTYVNAGHNFPLLRHGRGGAWEWINKKCGLFLGTFETAKYRQRTLALEPGDELVLYTDGVNEAFSASEEEYGNDRLEAFLREHSDERPDDLVQALRADVGVWAEGAEQSDDITILVVEYDVSV